LAGGASLGVEDSGRRIAGGRHGPTTGAEREARGRISPMAAEGCIARRALYKHKQTADQVALEILMET